jgi:hypothetical protein
VHNSIAALATKTPMPIIAATTLAKFQVPEGRTLLPRFPNLML